MKTKSFFAFLMCLAGIGSVFSADYAEAGVLAKDGAWEISVVYDNTVNYGSAISTDNYILPVGAELTDLRAQELNRSIILTVTGLTTNASHSITLTNIQDTGGAVLPALTLSVTARPWSWAAIGVQEFTLASEGISVGSTGFDLVSGGSQMSGTYDESTFVYETITGDFDRRVRVLSQEDSSMEARAGLMVREVLDEGKNRPIDPNNPDEAFSRYVQVHVNPVGTAFTDFDGTPVPGRNEHQINFRPLPGGNTENPAGDTNAPAYPNAWLRLKRVGQAFFVFRGTDGTNWVQLGTFSFPTSDPEGNPIPPFGSTAFVGPNYSPEVANIPESTGIRRSFLARFRDYSEAFGDVVVGEPEISIARSGEQVEITWTAGTLEAATNVAGNVWMDLGTASPLRLTPDKPYQFFRARNP